MWHNLDITSTEISALIHLKKKKNHPHNDSLNLFYFVIKNRNLAVKISDSSGFSPDSGLATQATHLILMGWLVIRVLNWTMTDGGIYLSGFRCGKKVRLKPIPGKFCMGFSFITVWAVYTGEYHWSWPMYFLSSSVWQKREKIKLMNQFCAFFI